MLLIPRKILLFLLNLFQYKLNIVGTITQAAIVLKIHHKYFNPNPGMYNAAKATNNPKIVIPTIANLADLIGFFEFGFTSVTHNELAAESPESKVELNPANSIITNKKTAHVGSKVATA